MRLRRSFTRICNCTLQVRTAGKRKQQREVSDPSHPFPYSNYYINRRGQGREAPHKCVSTAPHAGWCSVRSDSMHTQIKTHRQLLSPLWFLTLPTGTDIRDTKSRTRWAEHAARMAWRRTHTTIWSENQKINDQRTTLVEMKHYRYTVGCLSCCINFRMYLSSRKMTAFDNLGMGRGRGLFKVTIPVPGGTEEDY